MVYLKEYKLLECTDSIKTCPQYKDFCVNGKYGDQLVNDACKFSCETCTRIL